MLNNYPGVKREKRTENKPLEKGHNKRKYTVISCIVYR